MVNICCRPTDSSLTRCFVKFFELCQNPFCQGKEPGSGLDVNSLRNRREIFNVKQSRFSKLSSFKLAHF